MKYTLAFFLLCIPAFSIAQEKPEIPPELEQERELIFASTKVGSWSGFAFRRLASDYGANRIDCAISTPDATFTQTRAQESHQVGANWDFFRRSRNDLQIEFDKISVGRDAYELSLLPWRLAGPPNADGITLSNELSILSFRKNDTHQWLPISYLSDNLMDAEKFTISFTYESDDETPEGDRMRKPSKRTFDLRGFKEVSKWCGKQLLADRLDEQRVKALVE